MITLYIPPYIKVTEILRKTGNAREKSRKKEQEKYFFIFSGAFSDFLKNLKKLLAKEGRL